MGGNLHCLISASEFAHFPMWLEFLNLSVGVCKTRDRHYPKFGAEREGCRKFWAFDLLHQVHVRTEKIHFLFRVLQL